ncbi:MAG TPA: rhomboid family intramembrane serine protease [Solirubrobacteraceae bacterium]|nr:rhomboid family intramembrane serine protease [Solirubrobacteraceae bacterium]
MASGPDLFVVCKTCGSEVSPYITECPYCGTRLRKRAPKIERDGTVSEPRAHARRSRLPRADRAPRRIALVGPLRWGAKPWATIALVALSCAMWLALTWVSRADVLITTSLSDQPLRLLSSVLVYPEGWYQLAVLLAVAVFGWRLELRHGPLVVVALFALGGLGGLAVANVAGDVPAMGANGAALALLCAWAMRDGLAARRREPYEGDLIGAAVISMVVFLMPAAVDGASWIAGGVGVVVGALAGAALARVPE